MFVVVRNIGIYERTSEVISQLTNVWEQSVKATHLFLTADGIKEIKEYVDKTTEETFEQMLIDAKGDSV